MEKVIPAPASAPSPANPLRPTPGTMKRPARSTMLGSTFVDWATLPQRTTATGVFRAAFDAPAPTVERFELHVSTLNPKQSPHAPHCHPWEEILILKEGTVEVWINGATKNVGPGGVIFFAANDVHTVANHTDQPATYYVINFFATAHYGVRPEPAAEWAPADKLKSTVMNWEEGTIKEATHDFRRVFLNSPTVTFTSLKVHATTAAAHRYPVRHTGHLNPLLVIVKEGAVESTIDGVSHLVGAGSMIFLAPGAIQTIANRGDVPATYYVVAVCTEETPRAA